MPRSPDAVAESKTSSNPEAHDAYLRAAYFFSQGTPASLHRALTLARHAVRLDPSFVHAHWLIVKAEQNLSATGQQSSLDAERNSAANLKAVLTLDPASPEAHARIGFRTYVQQWDWPAAEKEFRIAVASGRSTANALNFYGWSLMTRGRFAEAHAMFDSALEIDPLAQSGSRPNVVIAWLMERKFDRAKRAVDSILNLNPNSTNAYGLLSWTALAQHDCTTGRRIQARLAGLIPATVPATTAAWDTRCGSPNARQERVQLLRPGSQTYFAPYPAAEAFAMLGDRDATLKFLNQAAEEKSDMILYLQLDPILDAVRGDPGIQSLARRIGLPGVSARSAR